MRIAVVAPTFRQGGAGKAAARMSQGLAGLPGCAVEPFCAGYAEGGRNFTAPGWGVILSDLLLPMAGPRGMAVRGRVLARRHIRSLRRLGVESRADAFHLHGFNQWDRLSFPLVAAPRLAARVPVLWTLHDAWPLNGRLDYPDAHEAADGGWHPQDLDAAMDQLLSRPASGWAGQRREVAACRRLAFVTPSAWLAAWVRRVWPEQVRVEVIANAVDATVFQPTDPAVARAALGWPRDRALIAMAATDWRAARKGGALWRDAAARIRQPYDLVLIGEGAPPDDLRGPGTVHRFGRVGDDRLLALAFSAADLIVLPSLFDNLPNILLEALACGTPCVGFAIGGLPEAIRPGVTGALAPALTGAALAAQVEAMLAAVRGQRADWSGRCRAFALAHYDPIRQARRHLDLLEELCHVAP